MRTALKQPSILNRLKHELGPKKRIDFTEKVTGAMELLNQLRFGNTYDQLYNQPLKYVSVRDIPKMDSFPEPLVVDHYGRMKGTVQYTHPRLYLMNFSLDSVNWFPEWSWDPERSDPFKYDWFSDEYIILVSNRKRWNKTPEQGTVSVGVSHLEGGGIRINSFSINYWIKGVKEGKNCGHEKILLSRQ